MRKDYELAVRMIQATGLEAGVVEVDKSNFSGTAIVVRGDKEGVGICVYPPKNLEGPRKITEYVLQTYYTNCNAADHLFGNISLDDFEFTTRIVNKYGNSRFLKNHVHKEVSDDLCEVLYLTKKMANNEKAYSPFPWELLNGRQMEELFCKAHERDWKRSMIKEIDPILGFKGGNLLYEDNDKPYLVFVTNKEMHYGASAILNPKVQERLQQLFPEGFSLIPSSIHEWIVASRYVADNLRQLTNIINEVNTEQVDVEERLSDHPYLLVDGRIVSA